MSQLSEPPLLSILIPTYGYPEGVARILGSLQSQPNPACELIVFDDSSDDEVEAVVVAWCAATSVNIRYQHNSPALGVAANWNALLDAANGKYCLLLHHDEFPLGDQFVNDLVTILRKHSEVDVLMLDCVLVHLHSGRNRHHFPLWLSAFIVKTFPNYLLRRNVIGPTSALVIRRRLYPRFDARLRWLIDVDLYVRTFKVATRLMVCRQVHIGSTLDRKSSITAALRPSIQKIERDERVYLLEIHPAAELWLRPVSIGSLLNTLPRCLEYVCWNFIRSLMRVKTLFTSSLPRRVVLKTLEKTVKQ